MRRCVYVQVSRARCAVAYRAQGTSGVEEAGGRGGIRGYDRTMTVTACGSCVVVEPCCTYHM